LIQVKNFGNVPPEN